MRNLVSRSGGKLHNRILPPPSRRVDNSAQFHALRKSRSTSRPLMPSKLEKILIILSLYLELPFNAN